MAGSRVLGAVILTLCAMPAFAQTGAGAQGAARVVRQQAPTDRAVDFPAKMLKAEFGEMAARKLITTRLLEGGSFSLNTRRIVGSEPAQVHKSIIEFYFVQEGTGTLVTGGTLANGKINGGVTRMVGAGDVVFIPPGVPHWIRETNGISYLNIHFGGTD
jgi:mannose-6-phosphate isomerase-like protein (cupin superfamily)